MTTKSEPRRKSKTVLIIILLFLCLFSFVTNAVLYIKNFTPQQLITQLGLAPEQKAINYSLLSWERSLEQLQYDADIIFIGDSLTNGNNFQDYFKNQKILNLGLSGDSLQGIHNRSGIISHFTPEKIFIQGGINNLASEDADSLAITYDKMINDIIEGNPTAKIYIQSVLPISNSKQTKGRTNENIVKLNELLKTVADKYQLTYIDLHSLYVASDEMNPEYTIDGIHLKDEYKHLWLNALAPFIY